MKKIYGVVLGVIFIIFIVLMNVFSVSLRIDFYHSVMISVAVTLYVLTPLYFLAFNFDDKKIRLRGTLITIVVDSVIYSTWYLFYYKKIYIYSQDGFPAVRLFCSLSLIIFFFTALINEKTMDVFFKNRLKK